MFVDFLFSLLRFYVLFLKATTKAQQELLANRYELKVAANKRAHW
jgi:hypothetical protein